MTPTPKTPRSRKGKAATAPDDSFTGDPPAPQAEVEPATVAPEADPLAGEEPAAFELADDVKGTIRGLYANGRELAALRLYRESFVAGNQAEPSLGEAKRAVEVLIGEAPPPVDFTLPADPPPEALDVPTPATPAPVDVQPPRGRVKLSEKTIDHAFDLTDDEFGRHAHHLATLNDDIVNEETAQAGAKKQMRERLAALENDRSKTAAIVRDRREVREVLVYEEADHDAGLVRVIVRSTGQVIAERTLAGNERQAPLFPGRVTAPPPDGEGGDGWGDEDRDGAGAPPDEGHDEAPDEEEEDDPDTGDGGEE